MVNEFKLLTINYLQGICLKATLNLTAGLGYFYYVHLRGKRTDNISKTFIYDPETDF
ncbi:MAG TPA: hypothetical protein VGE24_15410 [Emticicia sp.]